jgi:hypothetical protein
MFDQSAFRFPEMRCNRTILLDIDGRGSLTETKLSQWIRQWLIKPGKTGDVAAIGGVAATCGAPTG